MTAIRLLIVDDHPIMRDGLRGVFSDDPGFEVVGEAGDGAEAVRLAQRVEADVILMDLRMPPWAAWRPSPGCGSWVPGPGAHPHHLRHRPGRAARHKGRRHRVPAQGRAPGRADPRRAGRARRKVMLTLVAGALIDLAGDRGPNALSPREIEVLRLVADGATDPGGRPPAAGQRDHDQDPPAAHLHQARRPGPGRAAIATPTRTSSVGSATASRCTGSAAPSRCFSELKQFRAVATRSDKHEWIYQGTVDVASIRI